MPAHRSEDPRRHLVAVRLTEAEHDRVQAEASTCGMSVSGRIRMTLATRREPLAIRAAGLPTRVCGAPLADGRRSVSASAAAITPSELSHLVGPVINAGA